MKLQHTARIGLAVTLGLLSASTLAAAERAKEITFDTIKLDLAKGEPFKQEVLTEAVKKLEGTSVRIRGYILPPFQETGLKNFILVRDNLECCFGPGAALFDCVVVEMTGDATVNYTTRPVSVEGTFVVREVIGPNRKHVAIYHLDGTQVK